MKKTIKVGIILLILGLILAIFGIANNGIQSIYWQSGFHVAKVRTKTYQPAKIKSITLNTDADVTIKQGDTTKVTVSSARQLPSMTYDNGNVTIKSTQFTHETVGFIITPEVSTHRVTITIPKNTIVNTIKATKQTGNVAISNVAVKDLQLTTQSDLDLAQVTVKNSANLQANDVTVNKLTAPSLQADIDGAVRISDSTFTHATSNITSTADVTIKDTQLKSAAITATAGTITLRHNQLTSNLAAKVTDGDINVQTNRANGVTAKTSTGDLAIFGWHSDSHRSYQYKTNAKAQYQLTSTSGEINVTAS
ncbi:DUF4097 family beta strand repeat-containing protein [Lactiplantibacillus fabifermentans]|uniref:DUF4097 domain-containing protein n=2 Tax=Lactiplantibacillus fabifermentans TaxID=483011 RepID=A0A0R2NIA6_9LACO|nr:DUF4097 family beta strand repeat-containing protein [Lactiplantibacillus fabifermentans]ETY73134.1 membrane protein [Lactiplantibacillus fabifermentans T30PCM01]KRO25526.1 hypothetical protein DY78_GL001189 [Lactiplantibacillus fabifermentans DSM 21115]